MAEFMSLWAARSTKKKKKEKKEGTRKRTQKNWTIFQRVLISIQILELQRLETVENIEIK